MSRVHIAAHVHSVWSYDAKWTLERVARTFRKWRCDAVLMAEHDHGFDEGRWIEYQRACRAASTDRLALLPGMEYADPDNVVHTVVWGDGIPFLGAARPTLEILHEAAAHGAATVFAHPARRDALSRYTPEWRPYLSAIEIWNRKYDGVAPSREAQRLSHGEGIRPFVSLDLHSERQLFPLGISVELAAPPALGGIVDAIRAGSYRPELLRLPAQHFTRGPGGIAARSAERLRRRARRPARVLARRLVGGTKAQT